MRYETFSFTYLSRRGLRARRKAPTVTDFIFHPSSTPRPPGAKDQGSSFTPTPRCERLSFIFHPSCPSQPPAKKELFHLSPGHHSQPPAVKAKSMKFHLSLLLPAPAPAVKDKVSSLAPVPATNPGPGFRRGAAMLVAGATQEGPWAEPDGAVVVNQVTQALFNCFS